MQERPVQDELDVCIGESEQMSDTAFGQLNCIGMREGLER